MNLVWPEFLQTLFLLPVFLIISVLVFYLSGFLLLNRINIHFRDDEKISLAFGAGLVFFFLVFVISCLLNARFITPLVILFMTIYGVSKYKRSVFLPFSGLLKQKWLMIFLITGTVIEVLINFPSGLPFKDGHLYWSSQGHDGLWHVAIIEEIKNRFPANNPLYAGEKLYNYHYFSDAIMGEFNRIFPFFSSLDIYFRYFSILISFLMGLGAYSFLTTWKNNKTIGYLGIFFTFLVGSFGYLVLLIQGRGFFGGETIFWAAQGNTIIGNPPHAICYFLIPTFFLAFYHFLKQKGVFLFVICLLLGGFLVGFKVSAAVVLLAGLSFASLHSLITKQNRRIILLTAILGLTNFVSFKAITKQGESLLMFLPWWFVRTMIVVPDRVNWIDLELRRQFYLAQGGIRGALRVVEFETIAFFIFLFGNLGMRIIGFFEIGKMFFEKRIIKDQFEIMMFFTMITGFIVPILFVQKGVTYNMIQFMQYFLLIFGFYGAVSFYHLLNITRSKPLKILMFIVFVALSIPTVIGNFKDFYGKQPLAIISTNELAALNYLKNNTQDKDIILTKPFNPYSKGLYKTQPWPIYAWDSTGYVSAYTGKQTYYTDEGQIRILGINTEDRLISIFNFFGQEPVYYSGNILHYKDKSANDPAERINFLKKEGITYIYLRSEENSVNLNNDLINLGLNKVYSNPEVVIFKI